VTPAEYPAAASPAEAVTGEGKRRAFGAAPPPPRAAGRSLSRWIIVGLAMSLIAFTLFLMGIGKGAGDLAAGLFGLTLVLALLSILNDSDPGALR
jgi:hypothetical protein